MTATDELRRMLDERGVEHYDRIDVTEWVGADYEICHTNAVYSNGASVLVLRKCTTPAQAIAATVGRGTCHMVYNDLSNLSRCTACGWRMEGVPMYYCPRCGRKVVDE